MGTPESTLLKTKQTQNALPQYLLCYKQTSLILDSFNQKSKKVEAFDFFVQVKSDT